MSFRRRLALFLDLIAVVPMLALTVLLGLITRESREGKADAQASQALSTAVALYEEEVARAQSAARELGGDRRLANSLRRRDPETAETRMDVLLERLRIEAARASDARGDELAEVGLPEESRLAYAVARVGSPERALGGVEVWASSASEYVQRVSELTGLDAAVRRGEAVLAASRGLAGVSLPESGNVDLPQGRRRAATVDLNADRGSAATVFGDPPGSLLGSDQVLIALALVAFFATAMVLALRLLRLNVELHESVAYEAITDPLTGLANQRRFHDLLAKEIERAKRFSQPLSLLVIDLDGFKEINDTYGHPQGDEVLRRVALALTGSVREIDEPARYGGEEFVIALPQTDAVGAAELAERIRAAIESARIRRLDGDGTIQITGSIGAASLGPGADEAHQLLASADAALYEAKRAGKNRVVSASAPVGPESVGRGR